MLKTIDYDTELMTDQCSMVREELGEDETLFCAFFEDDIAIINIYHHCYDLGDGDGWYDGSKFLAFTNKIKSTHYSTYVETISEGMQRGELLYRFAKENQ